MPSLFLIAEGSDILNEELLSPYLQGKLDDFKAFVVNDGGKVHDFGKIRDIKKLR